MHISPNTLLAWPRTHHKSTVRTRKTRAFDPVIQEQNRLPPTSTLTRSVGKLEPLIRWFENKTDFLLQAPSQDQNQRTSGKYGSCSRTMMNGMKMDRHSLALRTTSWSAIMRDWAMHARDLEKWQNKTATRNPSVKRRQVGNDSTRGTLGVLLTKWVRNAGDRDILA
jgi:hypothetical protein